MNLFAKAVSYLLVLASLAPNTPPLVQAIDEGPHEKEGVGIYVYKSDAPYEAHIDHFIELHNGAHYYVQTPYTSNLWNLIGTIDLTRTVLHLDTHYGKNRVACISLNVLTELGGVDMGIENEGDGWFPFFYSPHLDKSDASDPYNQDYDRKQAMYPSAKKIDFSIDAVMDNDEDVVIGYFTFYDGNDSFLGQEMLTFYVPQGQLYKLDSDGNPKLRFQRFMSLLPYGADNSAYKDVADRSVMAYPMFKNLQLYHRDYGYQVWNMDHIAYAWSVQTANIPYLRISPSGSGDDKVGLYHSHEYH